MSKTNEKRGWCAACGMPCNTAKYHPYIACQLFESSKSSVTVRKNLQAVVEYGMKAQRHGVDIETAMNDISKIK